MLINGFVRYNTRTVQFIKRLAINIIAFANVNTVKIYEKHSDCAGKGLDNKRRARRYFQRINASRYSSTYLSMSFLLYCITHLGWGNATIRSNHPCR